MRGGLAATHASEATAAEPAIELDWPTRTLRSDERVERLTPTMTALFLALEAARGPGPLHGRLECLADRRAVLRWRALASRGVREFAVQRGVCDELSLAAQ